MVLIEVREVTAQETTPLRQQVLRGGRTDPLPGDDATTHFLGVYDGPVLVATGNVRPDPGRQGAGWWRIRGMATHPDHRGRGAGTAVLAALLDHARSHGAAGVWCNARVPARSLYERAGFTVDGNPWVDPEIGPHVRMVLVL